jgi:hypothetical protein
LDQSRMYEDSVFTGIISCGNNVCRVQHERLRFAANK